MASFWRQTNIKISPDLGTLFQGNVFSMSEFVCKVKYNILLSSLTPTGCYTRQTRIHHGPKTKAEGHVRSNDVIILTYDVRTVSNMADPFGALARQEPGLLRLVTLDDGVFVVSFDPGVCGRHYRRTTHS